MKPQKAVVFGQLIAGLLIALSYAHLEPLLGADSLASYAVPIIGGTLFAGGLYDVYKLFRDYVDPA